MMTGPILVFGRAGQVACELAKIAPEFERDFVFAGRKQIDLLRDDGRVLIESTRPAGVINAAAYTAVDKAETDRGPAYRLNGEIPGLLAQTCTDLSIPFVHLSTDYVFGGGEGGPYTEEDPVRPLGVYGETKALGERKVMEAGGCSTIIRTSWVYSVFGSNFVKTMLRLARLRSEVRVVADQLGCPTWARDVARGASMMLDALQNGRREAEGVFHLAGAGEASWAEFATAVFAESAQRGGPTARVEPIPSSDYPTPARRPADSRLASNKLERALGWTAPPWPVSLAACMDEMDLDNA